MKVSVIIPTYNRSHFIGEAINSVLAQDIKDCNIEIIVVDDGSTDNTREVVKEFGNKVRYIFQENQGAGAARNRGIEEANGEWISFLDSDDRWLPYKLSLQFKVLEAFPNYKAVHSNFYTFSENKIIIEKGLDFWVSTFTHSNQIDWAEAYSKKYKSTDFNIYNKGASFDIYTGNLFRAQLRAPYASCWTLLVHKDCLNPDIKFAEGYPTWEDYWFFCKLTEKHDIIFMDIATAENRGHDGPRLTQADLTEVLKCHIDACEKIFLPSKSSNRPQNEEIEDQHRMLHIILFKELLKKGLRVEANKILTSIKNLGGKGRGIVFWLFRLSLLLPFNVIGYLVLFKRLLHRT